RPLVARTIVGPRAVVVAIIIPWPVMAALPAAMVTEAEGLDPCQRAVALRLDVGHGERSGLRCAERRDGRGDGHCTAENDILNCGHVGSSDISGSLSRCVPDLHYVQAFCFIDVGSVVNRRSPGKTGSAMSLKFGTSGLRGLSSELAGPASALYVRAFARHLLESGQAKPGDTVLVGRDFRESSPTIAAIAMDALHAEGLHPADCGTPPTPALALMGLARRAACLMVTGSHIPADRNGIKFYRPDGEIDKDDEAAITRAAEAIRSAEMAAPARITP